jgi:hypothetical protein
MKISIDFDGVVCKRTGIPRSDSFLDEEPQEYAKEAIEWLMEQGHELYIQSNRDKDEILVWLKEHDFPLLEITNIKKLNTSIYLDDRAIRFVSWQDFCKLLG